MSNNKKTNTKGVKIMNKKQCHADADEIVGDVATTIDQVREVFENGNIETLNHDFRSFKKENLFVQLCKSGYQDVDIERVLIQYDLVPGMAEVIVIAKDQSAYRGILGRDGFSQFTQVKQGENKQ